MGSLQVTPDAFCTMGEQDWKGNNWDQIPNYSWGFNAWNANTAGAKVEPFKYNLSSFYTKDTPSPSDWFLQNNSSNDEICNPGTDCN